MKINLIPMAGEGLRFRNASYLIPKPLLLVDGLPMVVRAAKSLPLADRYIFVCQEKHIAAYPIKEILKEYFNDIIILAIDGLSEGQAMSCLMAEKYIPQDACLTIGACDNGMHYDISKFNSFLDDELTDGLVWTFKNNPAVLENPSAYSWVDTIPGKSEVRNVSCKLPISSTPLKDHAVVGTFSFKHASIFFNAVSEMIKERAIVNNELYVDMAINFIIKNSYKINTFEIEEYICWGTPKDYEKYHSELRQRRYNLG